MSREDGQGGAQTVPRFLIWTGDFVEVGVLDGTEVGPADAPARRPDLLGQSEVFGRRLAEGLR